MEENLTMRPVPTFEAAAYLIDDDVIWLPLLCFIEYA